MRRALFGLIIAGVTPLALITGPSQAPAAGALIAVKAIDGPSSVTAVDYRGRHVHRHYGYYPHRHAGYRDYAPRRYYGAYASRPYYGTPAYYAPSAVYYLPPPPVVVYYPPPVIVYGAYPSAHYQHYGAGYYGERRGW